MFDHPKKKVIYNGRVDVNLPRDEMRALVPLHKNIPIDVRQMISHDDVILEKLLLDENLIGRDNDATMLLIQKWVKRSIDYQHDQKRLQVTDHWQFPFEFIHSKTGDCEDGAILIASLGLNAMVCHTRLRVVTGFVQAGEESKKGGHTYAIYQRESDDEWVVLDWCWYSDASVPMKDKKPFRENPKYKEVWFSFNHLHAWSEEVLDHSYMYL